MIIGPHCVYDNYATFVTRQIAINENTRDKVDGHFSMIQHSEKQSFILQNKCNDLIESLAHAKTDYCQKLDEL